MTEAAALPVNINRGMLMAGLEQAARNYKNAMQAVGEDSLVRDGGLSEAEQAALANLNPDIIIVNALAPIEDGDPIVGASLFGGDKPKDYNKARHVADATVGERVAHGLFLVTDSSEAKALIPHRAVAIIEVNANRGFMRGQEDPSGCYGFRQGHLGHVVVDVYYAGRNVVGKSSEEHERPIDFMVEPDSLAADDGGLPRNAARILVRPSYPLVQEHWTPTSSMAAREIFDARLNGDPTENTNKHISRQYGVIVGDGNFCRAVSFGHDLRHWYPSDFESPADAAARLSPTSSS